jgi:sialate O-acetylesterase
MLWYQGESDSSAQAAPLFQRKFEQFVLSVRQDFDQPDLPFYYVQLGRVTGPPSPYWNVVQQAQRKAELSLSNSGMVAAMDVELDDSIQVSTEGQKTLGRRLANLACHDLYPKSGDCLQLKRGPRPLSDTYRDGVVRVTFSEVNGRLQADGRLNGFTVHTADGEVWPYLYKQRLDLPHGNAVLLHVSNPLPAGATVRYGYGNNPYCNLRDQLNMAAPAFGPLEVQP